MQRYKFWRYFGRKFQGHSIFKRGGGAKLWEWLYFSEANFIPDIMKTMQGWVDWSSLVLMIYFFVFVRDLLIWGGSFQLSLWSFFHLANKIIIIWSLVWTSLSPFYKVSNKDRKSLFLHYLWTYLKISLVVWGIHAAEHICTGKWFWFLFLRHE